MSKTTSTDPNARALQALEKQRRTALDGALHQNSTLIEVLADAHGTGETDLIVGLLQEVRQTLAMAGTIAATFDSSDAPLLEENDLETTFATLRRKLVAIEHLYFLKVASMAGAQAADVDEAAQ